jgi:hypothetical protein
VVAVGFVPEQIDIEGVGDARELELGAGEDTCVGELGAEQGVHAGELVLGVRSGEGPCMVVSAGAGTAKTC